ncbi:MAG: hypothetical protein JWP44_3561, partial [Mucilaginibacter sp.]|nr:hypothetical protein [Mucilaginibacter sp.]
GVNTYILTKNGAYLGTKPTKVYITFYHDKSDRITSGKVKDPLYILAAIFYITGHKMLYGTAPSS